MNIFDIINFVLNERSGCSADGSALALGERVKTVNERFGEGKCTKQGVEGAVDRNAQRLCDCTGRTKQLYKKLKLDNYTPCEHRHFRGGTLCFFVYDEGSRSNRRHSPS